jgi:hypothetical protein
MTTQSFDDPVLEESRHETARVRRTSRSPSSHRPSEAKITILPLASLPPTLNARYPGRGGDAPLAEKNLSGAWSRSKL